MAARKPSSPKKPPATPAPSGAKAGPAAEAGFSKAKTPAKNNAQPNPETSEKENIMSKNTTTPVVEAEIVTPPSTLYTALPECVIKRMPAPVNMSLAMIPTKHAVITLAVLGAVIAYKVFSKSKAPVDPAPQA